VARRSDVADLLGAADLCVLPSVWEARSLTAQEALRAGVPLVATRVGGIPELVGTAADLVPAGDAGALADAVTAVLTDPARATRLAAAGPRQAQQWPDQAATGRQLVAVYRELLGPPGGPGR
jgi:glycosyltransferase involved in cell wall biosynthesis